jgi:hypothetical protein
MKEASILLEEHRICFPDYDLSDEDKADGREFRKVLAWTQMEAINLWADGWTSVVAMRNFMVMWCLFIYLDF